MVDSNRFRQVAENVFYRFKDARFSVSNEYGDHAYTEYQVKCFVYPVIKYTPCGAWIGLNWYMYPTMPVEWREDMSCGKKFINLQANKKFALPTLEEAIESYEARKAREISIYQARIKGIEKHLEYLRNGRWRR